ncbi:LuxR C-terminal-related transcriptional regulator [Pseudomonas thivervalensis]|uniref:LuxR C-terminal-related transcriptional regulator n=1 Tax=Pseudomonas thivervalensis TaxID=86265 RepID=UPI00138FEE49|nr:LuxR C-terminal-related transcriptional regulator [Pseudomonas thivervalensis]
MLKYPISGLPSPKAREVLRCCQVGTSVRQIAKKYMRSLKASSGQKQPALRKLNMRMGKELLKMYLGFGGYLI